MSIPLLAIPWLNVQLGEGSRRYRGAGLLPARLGDGWRRGAVFCDFDLRKEAGQLVVIPAG